MKIPPAAVGVCDRDAIDRDEIHERVSSDALAFFNRTLPAEPAVARR